MKLLKLLSMGAMCGLLTLALACNGSSSGDGLPRTLMKFDGYTNPAWSFDGSVFTAQSTEDGGVYVLNEEGKASLLVAEAENGKWLSGASMFSYTRGGGEGDKEIEYVLLDYATQKETVLSGLDNVCGHAWSPDGKQLAITVPSEEQDGLEELRSELHVVDIKGKEIFLSDAVAGDRKCSPEWSPDGKYIYFASKTPEGEYYDREPLNVLHVEDDFSSEVVEKGSESRIVEISSTFDGWHAVYLRGRESSYQPICPRELGGDSRECLHAPEGISQSGAWSPARPVLAVTVDAPETKLFLYDPVSEGQTVIYENIHDNCGPSCEEWEASGPRLDNPAWSADGRHLAYTVQNGDEISVHVIDVEPWLKELD